MTFKVGDKVGYNKADKWPEMKGWEAEVIKVGWDFTKVKVTKNPGGYEHGVGEVGDYLTANLEPIKLTKEDFPVGTKVKITHPSYVGETGKVDSHTTRYIRVLLDGYGNRLFTPEELEIIEEKETVVTYKAGDRIEFVASHDGKAEVGDTAVVTAPEAPLSGWPEAPLSGWGAQAVKYKLDKNGVEGECFIRRVKPAPKFTFKDIEAGDTIRRTHTYPDGATVTKEGKVDDLSKHYARGKHTTLASSHDDQVEAVKLELIDRPEKPKHWAHTKPVGALAVMNTKDRILAATLTKTEDDKWTHNYVFNNNSRTYTNGEIARSAYGTTEPLNWLN